MLITAYADNNFCGLTNFNNPNAWNFADWYVHNSDQLMGGFFIHVCVQLATEYEGFNFVYAANLFRQVAR